MRDYRDAKAMAQTLRETLQAKSVSLTHSESLEIVARALGARDWNVLSAAIEASQPGDVPPPRDRSSDSTVLPVMALRDIVLFPQMVVPLFVGRDKTRRAIENAQQANNDTLLIVTQRRAGDDDPTLDDLYPVGVMAKLVQRTPLDDGTLKIFVSGVQRARVVRPVESEFLAAETALIEDIRAEPSDETRALSHEITETLLARAKKLEPNTSLPSSVPRLPAALGHFTQPGLRADMAAQSLQMLWSPGIDRMQQILETADVVQRLTMIMESMKEDRQAA
jgi:uncharacterized protein